MTEFSDISSVPSPKGYTSSKNPHTHTPWDCTEIVWNYFDWCMKYFPLLSQNQIVGLPISAVEKIQYFLFRPAIIYPSSENLSDWILSQNRAGEEEGSSVPHRDNPKYQAEYFDAYQRHGHTPYEGGEIIWNNVQWVNKLNTEMHIWLQTQPDGIKKGFIEKFMLGGEPPYIGQPTPIIAYNRHVHGKYTGGIIAQNEWMELAAENQRIYEFNQSARGEFNYELNDVFKEPKASGVLEEELFNESEKTGAPPSGAETFGYKSVTEIDNPVPSGIKIYNPAITAPGFGTEVIYNNKQLAIVLNKLIDEELIRTEDGGKFEVPDKPTKAYNVHFHTGPYDGGHLINHEHTGDSCGPIAANDFMETAIRNRRIDQYNEIAPSGEEKSYIDVPYGIEVLTEESQKSGVVPSGKEDLGYKSITEIVDGDDPTGSSIKKIFNPAITAPAFGTEVIFNNRQLAIVLNKLIDEGLMRGPEICPSGFEVPEEPTKGYNVHFHTGPYDGGKISVDAIAGVGLVVPYEARGHVFP